MTKTSKVTKKVPKKTLVIVESPSKAKTIGKYLGSRYEVLASVGHIRDLPKSKLGVDIKDNFEPKYINIRGKGDLIKELKKAAKKASKVYLATDPDREGEAISWHLAHILDIDPSSKCRVVFHEITKDKVKEAIKNPREIKLGLVDAQQARRVLDRLVGYQISPILWQKIRSGLSAGRVQSAALRIICSREREIQEFVPKEYWNILGIFKKQKKFEGKLNLYKGKKIAVENEIEAQKIVDELEKGEFAVASIIKKEKSRNPYPPFTTSSMQQEAGNKLNFNTKKTMMIAQELYEGVDIKGKGTVGLITYLRTDSVRISEEAKSKAKEYIETNFGKEYIGDNVFKNKKKDIQDAHEGIRPTMIDLEPEKIKESLTKDQYKLYSLIWSRFMASQMSKAKFNSLQANIKNQDYNFLASGSERIFDGYQKVYNASKDSLDKMLPALEEGEILKNAEIKKEQNFTKPPLRYTEASLIKELEEKEIGRPSTYAPIVITLIQRKYVSRTKKILEPTELGFLVNDLMEGYFKNIVDINFTANFEKELDEIELEKVPWKEVMAKFYAPFSKELKAAEGEIEKIVVEDKKAGELCEICGADMLIKNGRFGEFMACSNYPECKNTKPILKKIGITCPDCQSDLVVKRSRKGRIFYGCSNYPKCEKVFWDKPTNKRCPECNSLLVEKKSKGYNLACSNKECSYKE